jgi:hypothetical protein
MKKLYIALIPMFLFSPVTQADIWNCIDDEGRIYYLDDYDTVFSRCGYKPTLIIRTRGGLTKSEKEAVKELEKRIAKIHADPDKWIAERAKQKKQQQAEQEYQDKVRATAKFLDDVDAARKRR